MADTALSALTELTSIANNDELYIRDESELAAAESKRVQAETLANYVVEFSTTAEETAASVTPTNRKYRPGHLYRYGTNTTPGTTDMSTPVQQALDSYGFCIFPHQDEVFLSSQITLTGDAILIGNRSTVKGRASGNTFVCANHSVRCKGIDFTGWNNTLFVWQGSAVTIAGKYVQFQDCTFKDYGASAYIVRCDDANLADGSYFTEFRLEGCEVSRHFSNRGSMKHSAQQSDIYLTDCLPLAFYINDCHFHDGGDIAIITSARAGIVYTDTDWFITNSRFKNYRSANAAAEGDVHFLQIRGTNIHISNSLFEGLWLGAVGVHTGIANASVLTVDADLYNWETDELVGHTIKNHTDGSTATITANTGNTITGTLAGGTDNDWDVDDIWILHNSVNADDTEAIRISSPGLAKVTLANVNLINAGTEEGMLALKSEITGDLTVTGGVWEVTPEYRLLSDLLTSYTVGMVNTWVSGSINLDNITFRGITGAVTDYSGNVNGMHLTVSDCKYLDNPCDKYSGDYIHRFDGANLSSKFSGNTVEYFEGKTLSFYAKTGAFKANQVLTGGTSLATGTIVDIADFGTWGRIRLSGVSGTFIAGETITDGLTGSAKARGDGVSEVKPIFFMYAAGDINISKVHSVGNSFPPGMHIYGVKAVSHLWSEGDVWLGEGTSNYFHVNWASGRVVEELMVNGLKLRFVGTSATWAPFNEFVFERTKKISINLSMQGLAANAAATRPFLYDMAPDGVGRITRKVCVVDNNGDWANYTREIRLDQEAGGGITVTVLRDGNSGAGTLDVAADWDTSAGSPFSQGGESSNTCVLINSTNYGAIQFNMDLDVQMVGKPA